jgi:hypothetical protein
MNPLFSMLLKPFHRKTVPNITRHESHARTAQNSTESQTITVTVQQESPRDGQVAQPRMIPKNITFQGECSYMAFRRLEPCIILSLVECGFGTGLMPVRPYQESWA